MQGKTVCSKLGEVLYDIHHIEVGASRTTEWVSSVVSDGPQTESKFVLWLWG